MRDGLVEAEAVPGPGGGVLAGKLLAVLERMREGHAEKDDGEGDADREDEDDGRRDRAVDVRHRRPERRENARASREDDPEDRQAGRGEEGGGARRSPPDASARKDTVEEQQDDEGHDEPEPAELVEAGHRSREGMT